MNRRHVRTVAVAAITALALGAASGMAGATAYDHHRAEQAKTTAHAAAEAFETDAGAPRIRFDGLEDRFGELPEGASLDQVVAAMYPGDEAAQAEVIATIGAEHSTPVAYSGWGTAWKVTKCVAAIGGFVAGNAVLVLKLKKLGGVYKGAKLVVRAGNKEERLKALVSMFGEVTGIGAVATACG